jgi:hypothetical protein
MHFTLEHSALLLMAYTLLLLTEKISYNTKISKGKTGHCYPANGEQETARCVTQQPQTI